MKKILLSLITVGVVSAVAIGASRAFFTDTEKSVGNTFTAGAIDLQIDSKASYNGAPVTGSTWQLKDLNPTSDKFFSFADVKPGDWGENTISMHVINNDAWACLKIDNMQNLENTITEPEAALNDTDATGELAQYIYFTAWDDKNGNNIWETGESLLFANKMGPASDVFNGRTYAIADSTTGNPILGGTTKNIGLQWCFGTMDVNETTHTIACDGSATNNITQTDSLTADVTFDVVQAKNNPTYRCGLNNGSHELVLENKDPNWNRILNDGIFGVLTWAGNGDTFNFSLVAHKLVPSKEYSLIYYADPYPGNFPGYWFGNATANGSGDLVMSGNPDIHMNLPTAPDTNTPGAKIWLIPSSAYNTGTKSVIVWPFANDWLFESNLIQYTDTSSPI